MIIGKFAICCPCPDEMIYDDGKRGMHMKVLVLGSGAKDHAVAWFLSRSRFIDGLYVAPGNVGTATIATNIPIDPADFDQVYAACRAHHIEYVFIGTEAPLFASMVDKLNAKGIETFGAPSGSLKLEGDRSFARAFTDRHNIPMPSHKLFSDLDSLSEYLKRHEGQRFVVKSNGAAPSRVMVDTSDYATLMDFARTMLGNGPIILEEHLSGLSVTVTALIDNQGYLLLPFSSDYTKTFHEEGVPTGGMGSVCPVPLREETRNTLMERIINPTWYGMKVEHLLYRGVLTFSVILSKDGPILADYHVRFNDPATQAILPLVKNDAIDLIQAVRHDALSSVKLEASMRSSVAVVVASKGYPQKPETGKVLKPMAAYLQMNSFNTEPLIFFGGVQEQNGQFVTTSGRCVTVVGFGDNINLANKQAYGILPAIQFDGCWHRSDIGDRFFEN